MSVYIRFRLERNGLWGIWIRGDTYPIKEELKAMGFRWDKISTAWFKEGIENDEEVKKLCRVARERKWLADFCDFTTETITYRQGPRMQEIKKIYYNRE